jgi:hypothetical protein
MPILGGGSSQSKTLGFYAGLLTLVDRSVVFEVFQLHLSIQLINIGAK